MGVAGLVFEPPPPNFEKMHNFPRYTNDIIMNYGYFHWFKSLKKSLGVSFTDILVSLDLIKIFKCPSAVTQTPTVTESLLRCIRPSRSD